MSILQILRETARDVARCGHFMPIWSMRHELGTNGEAAYALWYSFTRDATDYSINECVLGLLLLAEILETADA